MRYVIVYLIKGKAEKYQQKLITEVGPKFNENYMIENPIPSHITIKSPFELQNSKSLEELLANFVKIQPKNKLEINGFGNFNRFVAYLKLNIPKPIFQIQKELLNELTKIDIPLHKFDRKWNPHATIAYGNTKESFNNIWNYLKTLDKPYFELEFDNISIMKKPKKSWKVYKTYKMA